VDSAGNLYYASGNGDWDGVSSFGDSVLKIGTAGGNPSLTDYFTPDNYADLQNNDLDLGSSGPLLIPGTNLLIQGSKTATFYVTSTALGHEKAGNNQIVQHFSATGSVVHSGPVFSNRATDAGPTLYVWLEHTNLQAFQFNGSSFNTTPISQSTIVAPTGHSAGVLTLSANGSTSGSGIIWSSMPIIPVARATMFSLRPSRIPNFFYRLAHSAACPEKPQNPCLGRNQDGKDWSLLEEIRWPDSG
jgi:hypothetical protein